MTDSVRCAHCGTFNAAGAENCRLCGKTLNQQDLASGDRPICISCGAHVHTGAETCTACGKPMRDVVRSNLPGDLSVEACVHWSEKPASASRTAKVSVAGILVLLAGFLGVAQAIISITPEVSEGFIRTLEETVPGVESIDNLMANYVIVQLAFFVFGVVAIFGSMFALMGSRFDLSLLGAVFGVVAFGFLLGSFLSLVALVLIATSRKEFLSECG